MALTEITLHLRGGVTASVSFDGDWEFKDSERTVLLLDGNRVVRAAANLTDFVYLTVQGGDGE